MTNEELKTKIVQEIQKYEQIRVELERKYEIERTAVDAIISALEKLLKE